MSDDKRIELAAMCLYKGGQNCSEMEVKALVETVESIIFNTMEQEDGVNYEDYDFADAKKYLKAFQTTN